MTSTRKPRSRRRLERNPVACINIVLILILKACIPMGNALTIPMERRQRGVIGSYRNRNLVSLSVSWSFNNDDSSSSSSSNDEDDDGWSMQEDWALMDQVPLFTVGEPGTPHVRTFWSQLAACTPKLAHKTPAELQARCQILLQQQQQQNSKSSSTEGDKSSSAASYRDISFGPSPPLLRQWQKVQDDTASSSSSSGHTLVGQTDDGRTIWIPYQCMGRLAGDPFSFSTSPSAMSLIPGGFVEAVGGRIYELGEPALNSNSRTPVSSFSTTARQETTTKEEEEAKRPMAWWIPATTGTVSAMVASTVLSACIGYGAGLGMIADPSTPSSSSSVMMSPSSPTTSAMVRSQATPVKQEIPLAERRAKTEYRILREQRMLQTLSDRLEQDQMELKALQQFQQLGP